MPKKIKACDLNHLINVPLPAHGDTYTVISHKFVIDYSKTALENAGFKVVDELYRCTADGNIASGIYKLDYNEDPELSMMFAWTNSYNKQVRFKCGIGTYVNKTGNFMVSKDMGLWTRKHTGNADTETENTIDVQVTTALMYYNQLATDKDVMKGVTLDKRKMSQLLGVLFADFEILTTEQASIVRDLLNKSNNTFNEDSRWSLWAFYNYVTTALQQSHPKTWMEDQRVLHYFIDSIVQFTVETPKVKEEEVNPDQVDLVDMIAEVEAENNELTEEELSSQLHGVDNNPEGTFKTEQQEAWDQQTRIEEGLDHKGGDEREWEEPIDEFDADAEMQEMKTELIAEQKRAEDEEPVNNSPEITGIPDGIKLSDTDDEDQISDAEAADIIKGQEAVDQQMAQEAAATEPEEDSFSEDADFDLDLTIADEDSDDDSDNVNFDF